MSNKKIRLPAMPHSSHYPRYIQRNVIDALKYSPVVLIQGPRQCGKTTIASKFLNSEDDTETSDISPELKLQNYITFDDITEREKVQIDPVAYLNSLPERVIFDEIQKAPQLLEAIKIEVDRNRNPGRFLLTGSCHVLQLESISDSLAGRMHIITLNPLAQCEIERSQPDLLDALLSNQLKAGRYSEFESQYTRRMITGGYPTALRMPDEKKKSKWYEDYSISMIERDLQELTRFQRINNLPKLLNFAAANTSNLLNINSLAAPLEESRPTIGKFLTLLERIFLLERLPSWHSNRNKRLIKSPKLHMMDTGLAASILRLNSNSIQNDPNLHGRLLETFVLKELQRQASWHDSRLWFSHFRDRDGLEVDIVIESDSLTVVGVEVKSAKSVNIHDFRGLRKLAALTGENFIGGIILYDGPTCRQFEKDLFAVPIRSLWEPLPN